MPIKLDTADLNTEVLLHGISNVSSLLKNSGLTVYENYAIENLVVKHILKIKHITQSFNTSSFITLTMMSKTTLHTKQYRKKK